MSGCDCAPLILLIKQARFGQWASLPVPRINMKVIRVKVKLLSYAQNYRI